MGHHAEPESTGEPESEPKTIMPEIMTNQEAFLMYGIFIFCLAVFCILLLVLYIKLKNKLVLFSFSYLLFKFVLVS